MEILVEEWWGMSYQITAYTHAYKVLRVALCSYQWKLLGFCKCNLVQ